MFFSINDVLQAWDSLSENMFTSKLTNGVNKDLRNGIDVSVDHSYITPTIIALGGDFQESKLNELVLLTQGKPVVIWNIGGKSWSSACRAAFSNQVIDCQWTSVGPYTRAPLLECVFALCQSIKSWYDLDERNLAIIYCPHGQPNTGILIACLLKYIGAFETTSQAYDFYCSKRLKGDPNHSLAPSYRTLFENVDKTVDGDGYVNTTPIHLKSVTLAGLPVEEVPCIEIQDTRGIVFSSHIGWKHTNMCTWNGDYGDGFYRISQDILGDFSIICRFGGHLASTKDKSTLIFKYQNSTAFLTSEVVELKHFNVDLNPVYADSIDIDHFTVHLMFEIPQSTRPQLPVVGNTNSSSNSNFIEPPLPQDSPPSGDSLKPYFKPGLSAFEAGLDEISKQHVVEPASQICRQLTEMGYDGKYVSVAVQLANNTVKYAMQLVEQMQSRAALLSSSTSSAISVNNFELMDESNLCVASSRAEVQTDSVAESVSVTGSEDSQWEVVDFRCPICNDESIAKSGQIIPCSLCHRSYHTTCVGLRKIPFCSKTEKDRENREKYIKKHFGDWRCPQCCSLAASLSGKPVDPISTDPTLRHSSSVGAHLDGRGSSSNTLISSVSSKEGSKAAMSSPTSRQSYSMATGGGGVIVTDRVRSLTTPTGQPWAVNINPSGGKPPVARTRHSQNSNSRSPLRHVDPAALSKTDQVAMLMGLLATNGLTVDSLLCMSQEKQREALLSVIASKQQKASQEEAKPNNESDSKQDKNSSLDLATALKGLIPNKTKAPTSANLTTAQMTETPRHANISTTAAVVDPSTAGPYSDPSGRAASGDNGNRQNNHRSSAKNNMLQNIENKKFNSIRTLMGVNDGPGRGGYGGDLGGGGGNGGNGYGGGGWGHQQGIGDGSGLSGFGPGLGMGTGYGPGPGGGYPGGGDGIGSGRGGGGGDSAEGELSNINYSSMLKLKDIQEFKRYFTMIKLKIPKQSVADKMYSEGVVASPEEAMRLLNADPEQPLPSSFFHGSQSQSPPAAGKGTGFISLASAGGSSPVSWGGSAPESGPASRNSSISHSSGGFPFRQHQPGLPAGVFESFPGSGGVGEGGKNNGSNLRGPTTSEAVSRVSSGDGFSSSSSGEMVPLSEHPKFKKYFSMLSNGIETSSIKKMMQDDGVDPVVLDKSPDALIALAHNTNGKHVAVSEHPTYNKYFKMVKEGVAVEVVKSKMEMDGIDSSIIDKPPDVKIPLEAPIAEKKKEKEEDKTVALNEHPLYAKFFKMLKVGIPLHVVKAKMQQEGLDPAIMDKQPDERVPLNENKPDEEKPTEPKKVPLSEHPLYAKFFKMLKVGIPLHVVKAKLQLEGLDPSMLDKPADELVPLEEKKEEKKEAPKEVEMVAASEHPSYAKFFKMLKVGIPLHVVKLKVQAEGLDPTFMDKPPDEKVPLKAEAEKKEEEKKVAAAEHPSYAKFFKMLKVGIPLHVVKLKVQAEGLDPSFMDKPPDEMVTLSGGSSDAAKDDKKAAPAAAPAPKPRKKKLYWKALDASKVGSDSLWADQNDGDIMLDEDEFNKLFVDSGEPEKKVQVAEKEKKEPKKTKVILVNMKRAQNAGIALARIKMSFEDLKTKISNMNDEGLTTDQLKSLEEFLPTPEEVGLISNYKGDKDNLGQAEKYMLVMLNFTKEAPKRIHCMIYKQQFKSRVMELRAKMQTIETACDDVRMSVRLKKVLKTILKVGNQLNDGEVNMGFTLDSLQKLNSAKAFDKKTSVLQYVITLIYRNDPDCLQFPEDLKSISEASKLVLDMVISEKNTLREEFDNNFKIVMDIQDKDKDQTVQYGSMIDFLTKANMHCDDLEKRSEKVKSKFLKILEYFGEDTTTTSDAFFLTLHKFVQEFVQTREAVERLRKQELRRQAAEQSAALKKLQSEANSSKKNSVAGEDPASAKDPARRQTTFVQSNNNATEEAESTISIASESGLLQEMIAASTTVSVQSKRKSARRASAFN